MGLDMYLEGRKFIWASGSKPEDRPMEDGFEVKERTLRLGYWRKHPNLHGYIVEEFANGEDNCQEIDLDADALRKIMDAIKARNLPETTGFFFGKSYGTDEEANEDLGILQKALDWLETKEPQISRDVVYRASW
jgi:hypothetical protein